MNTYAALVDQIAALHTNYSPLTRFVPHPLAIKGQWIPSVVDTTTFGVQGNQPVIVAVGANYATSPNIGPTIASARHRTCAPWVEEDLGRWRQRTIRFLSDCATGHVKHHWNGLMPLDWDQNYASNVENHMGANPHFVMANVSPWITRKDWSVIRDDSLEDLFGILAAPSMGSSGLWGYLRGLKKCVGRDAIWLGHGNAEIYGIFRLFCWKLKIQNWFFDSNLSQKSWMTLPKLPAGRSTSPPSKPFPTKPTKGAI